MTLIRKTYLLEEAMLEKMDILKDKLTLTTDVNVVRTAINLLWKDTFKYGTDPLLNSSIPEQAEQKVKVKLKVKETVRLLKEQPKIDFCINELHGTVVENAEGVKICHWETHDVSKSHKQSIPLMQCGDYLLENLFIPDRETVLKARPELKRIFSTKK